jgi:hypothetical protein
MEKIVFARSYNTPAHDCALQYVARLFCGPAGLVDLAHPTGADGDCLVRDHR